MKRPLLLLALASLPVLIQAKKVHAADDFRLVIPDVSPGARVMGIKLVVQPGRVSRMPNCPPGWSMSVFNDPNWSATFEAHAIVGAAAITARQASAMILISSAPNDDRPANGGAVTVEGELTTMRDGDLQTRRLSRIALVRLVKPARR